MSSPSMSKSVSLSGESPHKAPSTPPVLSVHTPSSSFGVVHSLIQGTLLALFDQLSRKAHTDYQGERVGPGWLKYEWNDTIWNLDDDADYTIFVWRQQQPSQNTTGSTTSLNPTSPVLHLQNPAKPLPTPPAYLNPAFYLFQPSRAHSRHPHSASSSPRPHSSKRRGKASKRDDGIVRSESGDSIPVHKKQFENFHAENGVRTVIGSIGPVNQVRMLLKAGHRHVYISRKFAMKHGFIPPDAAPGHYGYGGLVNIGVWPIVLTPASSFHNGGDAPSSSRVNGESSKRSRPKPTRIDVYLSEEQHFDVVLGRSFFERRQIQTNVTDPTDVVCLDTGEKIECELVILKDGRGQIVTVT